MSFIISVGPLVILAAVIIYMTLAILIECGYELIAMSTGLFYLVTLIKVSTVINPLFSITTTILVVIFTINHELVK